MGSVVYLVRRAGGLNVYGENHRQTPQKKDVVIYNAGKQTRIHCPGAPDISVGIQPPLSI